VKATKTSVTTKKPETKTAKTTKAAQVEGKDVSATAASSVSQTTDAAALAAIDTSGYVLPSVKVPGRRGRKPKEFQPESDEVAALNTIERTELKAADKAKAKDRKAKEKALLKDAFSSDTEASEEELERRRQKLKTLIKLGKERGFLTFSEINDHLPENIVDPEAIEGIIGTFSDMGISVYEHAPDAETLLLSDNVANVASDDDAEAAAEAALSTVDSDFGRTTDPVRMYMREMGSVELLTREGEIEIAKRIEDGLKDMIQAISACPTTIAEILAAADRISKDEIKVDEIVDGLVDPTRANSRSSRRFRLRRGRRREEEEEERRRRGKREQWLWCRWLLRRTAGTVEARRAGQVRRHRHPVREHAQGLREGRLQLQALRQGAGNHFQRAAGHPLHRQDRREAVRHPACAGGRSAYRGTPDPGRGRQQVQHAAPTSSRSSRAMK
jgi:RNA polymerase primary sigma factor